MPDQYGVGDDITGYWERNYQQWLAVPEPDWQIFDAKDQWFETRFEHLLPPRQELGGRFPIGACLDWGCGNAMFARPLLRRFQSYYGFDTSQTAIQIAKRYWTEHKPPSDLWLEHYTGRPGNYGRTMGKQFDLVMSITVLQHQPLPYRLAMIQNIKQLLRPTGMYLGLEWIGDTKAYDMPPMSEEVWRAAWWPWELTFDNPPEHPDWAANNVWTAALPVQYRSEP